MNNLALLLYHKGDYPQAESLHRRALEGYEQALGKEHPETLISVNNLALILLSQGKYDRAEPLCRRALLGLFTFTRPLGRPHPHLETFLENYIVCLQGMGISQDEIYAKIRGIMVEGGGPGPSGEFDHQEVSPEQVRSMALECYKRGDYAQAKELLELLLDTNFEVPGTLLHLVRLDLVTDDIQGARKHVAEAWEQRADAKPYVVSRILWCQLALAILEEFTDTLSETNTLLIGRLKTALESDASHMEWDMDPVLTHLRPKLTAEHHALLTALVAALSDRANLSTMDQFLLWREAEPQPL